MADFMIYAPLLHSLEKGISNSPYDRGGFTVDGVTLATFRRFYGQDKTEADLRNMTRPQWRHIMKTGYWDVCRADQIENQALAELIVDWCVNSGTARIRNVQTILEVRPDGCVGPITLSALNSGDASELYGRVMAARRAWFERIVRNDPTQKRHLTGWMNRLDRLKNHE